MRFTAGVFFFNNPKIKFPRFYSSLFPRMRNGLSLFFT